MIPEHKTNKVYFSEILKYDIRSSRYVEQIEGILKRHHIEFDYLKGTKDIWCRDYMPIQIEKDKFVKFRYEPSYLKDDLHLQSNPADVIKLNSISPTTISHINLDGGNVVRWKDKAILTDRIFNENSYYKSKSQLIDDLQNELEAELFIMPALNKDEDMTGHSDGYLRFLNEKTLLISERRDDDYKYWVKGFDKMINEGGFDYKELPMFEHKDKCHPENAIGLYVNYLEVSNLIIFPVFGIEGNRDTEALNAIKKLHSDRDIETININDIGLHGGLLNCISWNIAT